MPRKRDYLVSVDEKMVGERLKELRNQRGKTQVQLAELLGMDQSLLSRYERGELRLHAGALASFAKALRTTTDAILGLRDAKAASPSRVSDQRLLRRLRLIEGLPRRKKEALLTTIDTFLGQQES